MCGIAGVLHSDPAQPADAAVLRAMARVLVHRGPDEEGYLLDGPAGLASRRLQVLDLTGGSQPLYNEDRSIAVVANGEIYNFRELRRELESRGHTFRSRSDCEVIVHQYEEDGPDCLERFNGMFALALWDGRRRRLLLARDRLGIKPLHFRTGPEGTVFASEIKAILAHPGVPRELDPVALSRYLAHECVPAPRTLFRGIEKLPPGHRLILGGGSARLEPWWRIRFSRRPAPAREEEALDELEHLLDAAVERRLVSDVPLGAFLSGGVDSSTIVALMQRHLGRPVETFSIGFDEPSYDESAHAREAARHIGTRHHERVLRQPDLLDLFPRVADILDEPLGDASFVPTLLLSSFTREGVTVALSGDGGDELFGGYPTYPAHRAARLYRRVPRVLRERVLERLVAALPVSVRNFSVDFIARRFVAGAGLDPLERHVTWMGSLDPGAQRDLLTGDVRRALDEAHDDPYDDARRIWEECDADDELGRILHLDMRLYLQDDILTKVDRASMAHSLEVRVPMLDHTVVDLATSMPASWKLRGWTTKHLFKKLAARMLPPSIVGRRKRGFGMPVAGWLRGGLRELASDLLEPGRLRRQGVLDPDAAGRLLREHLAGRANHRKALYTLLMFQLWRERWLDRPATRR